MRIKITRKINAAQSPKVMVLYLVTVSYVMVMGKLSQAKPHLNWVGEIVGEDDMMVRCIHLIVQWKV